MANGNGTTYRGFCTRQDLGCLALSGWWDDLTTAASAAKMSVEEAAKAESKLTLWKIAAAASCTVAVAIYLFRK